MKRKEEKKVGSLLDLFIKQNGLEEGFAEYKLIKSWGEMLPPLIVRKTMDLKIRNRILYVTIHSSVIRDELSMMQDSLLVKLNEAAGIKIIDSIVFR